MTIEGKKVTDHTNIDSNEITDEMRKWTPEQKYEFLELIAGEQRRLRNVRKRKRKK